MSWSLAISGGDLVVGGGQLGVVTGRAKLVQDLTIWILQHMGSDPYNPSYGSLIDGGVKPDGTVISSPIGTAMWDITQTNIQNDIIRIISLYQSQQNSRARQDAMTYNKQTLTPDEILVSLDSIDFVADQDTLTVNIQMTTAAKNPIFLAIPVQGTIF